MQPVLNYISLCLESSPPLCCCNSEMGVPEAHKHTCNTHKRSNTTESNKSVSEACCCMGWHGCDFPATSQPLSIQLTAGLWGCDLAPNALGCWLPTRGCPRTGAVPTLLCGKAAVLKTGCYGHLERTLALNKTLRRAWFLNSCEFQTTHLLASLDLDGSCTSCSHPGRCTWGNQPWRESTSALALALCVGSRGCAWMCAQMGFQGKKGLWGLW